MSGVTASALMANRKSRDQRMLRKPLSFSYRRAKVSWAPPCRGHDGLSEEVPRGRSIPCACRPLKLRFLPVRCVTPWHRECSSGLSANRKGTAEGGRMVFRALNVLAVVVGIAVASRAVLAQTFGYSGAAGPMLWSELSPDWSTCGSEKFSLPSISGRPILCSRPSFQSNTGTPRARSSTTDTPSKWRPKAETP